MAHEKEYTFQKTVYLSVMRIINNDNEEVEIRARITKGSRKYIMLLPLIKYKYCSRRMKIRIYNVIIKSTVMHESEVWVLI